MLSEEILSLAEYIKTRDLYPPVVKTGYPPEDILLSDPGKTAARLRRYIRGLKRSADSITASRRRILQRSSGSIRLRISESSLTAAYRSTFRRSTALLPGVPIRTKPTFSVQ